VFEGLWVILWIVVVLWLLCLLGARTGIPVLGIPWRAQKHMRRRLRHADAAEDMDLDGFALGTDARGRDCYVPEPGVHVYGVGHRHPISNAPRVCVRRLEGEAVFCDRAGKPLRRSGPLPAARRHRRPRGARRPLQPTNTASGSSALTTYSPASTISEILRSTHRLQSR
jgi:hypothetical protein